MWGWDVPPGQGQSLGQLSGLGLEAAASLGVLLSLRGAQPLGTRWIHQLLPFLHCFQGASCFVPCWPGRRVQQGLGQGQESWQMSLQGSPQPEHPQRSLLSFGPLWKMGSAPVLVSVWL